MIFAIIFLLMCRAALMDSAAILNATAAAGIEVIDIGNQGLFEGDIVKEPLEKPSRVRNGILPHMRWPNFTIPYTYGADWSEKQIEMIQGVIKEIENYTCIRFVKRTNEITYINIMNGTGCSSPVGFNNKGVQNVSLKHVEKGGTCWVHQIVLHEFLHTVGLWHEQARYDRDDFLSINYDNVKFCNRFNFDIQPSASSNTYGLPYNYLSVMHYGKTSFSSNKGVTMVTKDPKFADLIGNVKHGHALDYDKINRIYQCGEYKNYTAPPPVGPVTSDTSAAGACVDMDCRDDCATRVKDGQCNKNYSRAFMKKFCAKSCNICQLTTASTPADALASTAAPAPSAAPEPASTPGPLDAPEPAPTPGPA